MEAWRGWFIVFSYFGSKGRIIHRYPHPVFPYIVEPFAGSARYACRWGLDRDVWINDKYPVIYRVWKWIQAATLKDVMDLPELGWGEDLRDYKQLSSVERELLGFAVNVANCRPCNKVTYLAARWTNSNSRIVQLKNNLRSLVGRISHWKITCLDYSRVKLYRPATYFVDPPYHNRKSDYVITNNSTFYKDLADYCIRRKGQIIVCEGRSANWLPFKLFYRGTQTLTSYLREEPFEEWWCHLRNFER